MALLQRTGVSRFVLVLLSLFLRRIKRMSEEKRKRETFDQFLSAVPSYNVIPELVASINVINVF